MPLRRAVGVPHEHFAQKRFDLCTRKLAELPAELSDLRIGWAIVSQPLQRDFHLRAAEFGHGGHADASTASPGLVQGRRGRGTSWHSRRRRGVARPQVSDAAPGPSTRSECYERFFLGLQLLGQRLDLGVDRPWHTRLPRGLWRQAPARARWIATTPTVIFRLIMKRHPFVFSGNRGALLLNKYDTQLANREAMLKKHDISFAATGGRPDIFVATSELPIMQASHITPSPVTS